MTNGTEDQSGGRFQGVQPLRDLESNWAVDLAKNLEEYLLKICTGEISGNDDSHLSINFAEAALLLQGSIQVYSRKVEYLYNLVVHALEFISQKRQQDQPESTSAQPEESSSGAVPDEEHDLFWGSEDIPVEAKNLLNDESGKAASLNQFVKPPANLVVLEGDCLDTTGDGGELESYLLATNDLYRDFILLDPCDAVAVQDFLQRDLAGKGHNGTSRGSCLNSKARKTFQSPIKRSGGSAHKSSHRKNHDDNGNGSPWVNHTSGCNDLNMEPDLPPCGPANINHGCDLDDGFSEHMGLNDSDDDSDEDNDPWKPLNPHEPGDLKVKPFKKVKAFRRHGLNSLKRIPITTQFPPAKMHGTISPELMEMWEKQHQACERQRESQSPPLYEKLRESLIMGGNGSSDAFRSDEVDNEDNGYDSENPDFGQPDVDMPQMMDEDVPIFDEKHDDGAGRFDKNDAFEHEDPHSHASLEDLCRSHLDALLASIAEAEKQTELAARVSTWKQKIEHNLEEQDSRPPFDIHDYGDRILDKLSLKTDNENVMSFTDVVAGQEKHDIARSFSALLQLVNNGDVDLDRNGADGESTCYSAVNPFHVRLLRHDKRHEELQLRSSKKRSKSPTKKGCTKGDGQKAGREKPSAAGSSLSRHEELQLRSSKKRAKSPTKKECAKGDGEKARREKPSAAGSSLSRSPSTVSQLNCKFPVKVGKTNGIRCTPEGKRRRRSRFVEPVDLHSGR